MAMKKSTLLSLVIGLTIMLRPGEVHSAMWRNKYRTTTDGTLSQIKNRYQQNYITPLQYMPRQGNYLLPAQRSSLLSPLWQLPTTRPYYQQIYRPWKMTTPRLYHPRAPPPTPRSPEQPRTHESQSSCLPTMNPSLEMVLRKAVKKENENRGKQKAEIVKSISNSDVKQCSECIGGSCTTYKNVEMAMTIAPACKTKSKYCICGVDRSYPKRMCTVSAKVDTKKGVYDLMIFCERRIPTTELKAWRRKQKAIAKRRRQKAKKAKKKKRRKRKKKKLKKPKRLSAKLRHKSRSGNEISEELDSSAEGPERQKPVPIVEWDERTSQATVIYSGKLLGVLDSHKTLH